MMLKLKDLLESHHDINEEPRKPRKKGMKRKSKKRYSNLAYKNPC